MVGVGCGWEGGSSGMLEVFLGGEELGLERRKAVVLVAVVYADPYILFLKKIISTSFLLLDICMKVDGVCPK